MGRGSNARGYILHIPSGQIIELRPNFNDMEGELMGGITFHEGWQKMVMARGYGDFKFYYFDEATLDWHPADRVPTYVDHSPSSGQHLKLLSENEDLHLTIVEQGGLSKASPDSAWQLETSLAPTGEIVNPRDYVDNCHSRF